MTSAWVTQAAYHVLKSLAFEAYASAVEIDENLEAHVRADATAVAKFLGDVNETKKLFTGV
jgi:hypothetical protein